MSESDSQGVRKKWTDLTTKWLIEELKIHYAAWRLGQIHNKKLMWLKVANGLGNRGYKVTAEQAGNRFKTLQRSYRKTYGINADLKDNITNDGDSKNDSDDEQCDESFYIDAIETFITDINKDNPTQDIKIQIGRKCSEINPEEPIIRSHLLKRDRTPTENVLQESIRDIQSNNKIKRKLITPSTTKRVKFRQRALNVTNTADILLDIKELIKKVEIRRQIRHEQSLKVATERNRILKRKNELLAKIVYDFDKNK